MELLTWGDRMLQFNTIAMWHVCFLKSLSSQLQIDYMHVLLVEDSIQSVENGQL